MLGDEGRGGMLWVGLMRLQVNKITVPFLPLFNSPEPSRG